MKIAVIFGAGAEAVKPYCMSCGEDFSKSVIGIDTIAMNQAIKKYYKDTLKLDNWYPNYSATTINEERLLKAAIRKSILMQDTDNIDKYRLSDRVDETFNRVKNNRTATSGMINKFTSYMGVLDSKFFTLIEPQILGPKNFWTVVDCYTRAYLLICQNILFKNKTKNHSSRNGRRKLDTQITADEYLNILKNPRSTYERIIAKINSLDIGKDYYSIIKEHNDSNSEKIEVITCNYTPICEVVTGISNISYIHGKLGMFENPYTMQVEDFSQADMPTDKLYFPFLMLQSALKPIVCKWQIDQYASMYEKLKKANRVIIVGYRVNCDDNDLNSAINEYINSSSDNELVYLDFNGDLGLDSLKKQLRIDDSKRIIYEKIDLNNSYEVFEKYLNY